MALMAVVIANLGEKASWPEVRRESQDFCDRNTDLLRGLG